MDREKVIRAFEQYVYNFVELTTTDEYNHQILEQVLALLKEQEAAYQGAEELLCQKTILFDDAIKRLKEQEAVEPKTGHWIWLQFCANEGVYCSECHTKMFDRYPMKKKLSQFCGHCGAKMDDEVEGR